MAQGRIAEVVKAVHALPLQMFYKAVLIFADTKSLAAFIEHIHLSGAVYGNEYTFVGYLTEEQIRVATREYGAYVRAARVGD